MDRHTITEAELNEWFASRWMQFAASFGERSNKFFEMSLDGWYRVTDHQKIVYHGRDKTVAIERYNEAE